MSVVSTVVIFTPWAGEPARAMLETGYMDDGRSVFFKNLTKADGWGGGRHPLADVFGGAFNHLDPDTLHKWLGTVPFREPAVVVWEIEGEMLGPVWTFTPAAQGSHAVAIPGLAELMNTPTVLDEHGEH